MRYDRGDIVGAAGFSNFRLLKPVIFFFAPAPPKKTPFPRQGGGFECDEGIRGFSFRFFSPIGGLAQITIGGTLRGGGWVSKIKVPIFGRRVIFSIFKSGPLIVDRP